MLHVHLAPPLVEPDRLAGATVVVIDLVRATTTICHALAAGARCVVPVATLEEALARYGEAEEPERWLLGGERGALRPQGFHLGNSPREYTPRVVRDRQILFTTSNGTRAMLHAAGAARVVLASFVNFAPVVQLLQSALATPDQQVHILCAGVQQQPAAEDTLLAGALAEAVCSPHQDEPATEPPPGQDNGARQARLLWRQVAAQLELDTARWSPQATRRLAQWLERHTPGGRNLTRVGQAQDLLCCAELNRRPVLPQLLPRRGWAVRLAGQPSERVQGT